MKLLELTPSQKKTVRHQFDNFCKKVLREEARNYAKHIAWRSEHEVSLSELSEEQINRAYILDEHPSDYVAMNLSFACSLRIGEILGLTWDNIHISDADIARDDAHLCVEKVLWRVREDTLNVLGTEEIIKVFPRTMYLENASTVIVLKTPKTESSVRKVWMPKTVAYAQTLLSQLQQSPELLSNLTSLILAQAGR